MAVLNCLTAIYIFIIYSQFVICLTLEVKNRKISNSSEPLEESSHVLLTDSDPSTIQDTNGQDLIAINQNKTAIPETSSIGRNTECKDGINCTTESKSILSQNLKLENTTELKNLIKIEKANDLMKAFINISNHLSIKLYALMSSVYPNFIFSPISISVMLTILLRASTGNSYNEINKTLELNKSDLNITSIESSAELVLEYFKLSSNSMSDMELEMSNGICLRDGTKIITKFHKFLNSFGAKVKGINFKLGDKRSDLKVIKWVEDQTKSRLVRTKIMLEPIKEDTNVIVLNGMYLSAVPNFQNSLRIKSDFYAMGSHVISTQFIQRAETVNTTNSKLLMSSILEIPFHSDDKQKRFALIIVLPHNNHSLESVEKQIIANRDQFFTELSKLSPHFVNVMIPQQFIGRECWRLDRILPHIGLKSVFQPETSLLTKISAFESLHISRIYHESYFEFKHLDNDIFHASHTPASTESQKQPVIESDFIANRPFLYMIIERNSTAVIMMGRISII